MTDNSGHSQISGCMMSAGLYLKANGEMPCWDDAGEELILRRLSPEAEDERELFGFPALIAVRQAQAEGRTPHPGICERCAVRGHGRFAGLRPVDMAVFHVEPSFLCHLACPQCIPPRLRRSLKDPPYNMPLAMFTGALASLRRDGVAAIRLVLFEGRGDPLMNKRLGEMAAAARAAYPAAYIMATTHGNYPYRPWMASGVLDTLRVAADGAFPDSYRRYRVNGDLHRALALMRDIRAAQRTSVGHRGGRVEWKYVLFEWNDSDAEIREAARLADSLDVRLRFCLTHSPGRSPRFATADALAAALAALAPRAATDLTFQLKSAGSDADVSHVVSEHAASLLDRALNCLARGSAADARCLIADALALDPGLPSAGPALAGPLLAAPLLPVILPAARFPATLSGLANAQLAVRDLRGAELLFRRYLELAPAAADHAAVTATLRRIRRAQLLRPLKRLLAAARRKLPV